MKKEERVAWNKGLPSEEQPNYGKHQSEEAKIKSRKSHKANWENEEYRNAHSGKNSTMFGRTKENDEGCKKISETMTGKEPTKAMIEGHKISGKKISKALIVRNKKPTETMIEGHKKTGKTYKIKCQNPTDTMKEGYKKIALSRIGEKNGNWKGGISNLPYCEKFDDDLKERVRDFFYRKCYVCGKNEIDNGQRLSVHHVNYNKMVCCDDVKPLFVPLCRSCHAKTHSDREYWEEFFTVSLNYLTNGECFLPKGGNKK